MPAFEPVERQKPATVDSLIQTEIARLQARRTRLKEGLSSFKKSIEELQSGEQAVRDEIESIDANITELSAACKKLNGRHG
jgi:peptidoglycan hydrolase CwlO-like protein